MTVHSRTTGSALWEFAVGGALCFAGVYLLHIVDCWGSRGVNAHLNDAYILLQHYGGKWLCAALVVAVGLVLCRGALRRLMTAPQARRFATGTMTLDSARWINRAESEVPAKTALPSE